MMARMSASNAEKTSPQAGVLESVIGYRIAKARITTQALFLRHIGEPFELRPVEFTLLMLLQANGALTPKQLARELALSGPNLTLLLDRMQERGHIARQRSETDRRSQQVLLTESGTAFASDLARRTPEMERELGQSLSAAERAMLIELLDKVASHRGPAFGDEA
jgi:DNA-binding MarR family transcriptional regulator